MDFQDKLVPFWNRKKLVPPPLVSFKISTPGNLSAELATEFNNIISVLENQAVFHADAALISRLLYRTRSTLRNDKGYKGFQKIQQVLRNSFSLNLHQVVLENRCASYDGKGPSREMLEWCLVSLQRFAALYHRLEKTCIETAYYLHNHITTGNRWHLALIFLACLSRVWTFSRYFLLMSCEKYLKLKQYLNYLESNGQWLPDGYKLPNDLQSWLKNSDYLNNLKTNEVLDRVTQNTTEKTKIYGGLSFNEDIGEVLSRDENSLRLKDKTNTSTVNKPEDIEVFLKEEEYNRSNNITGFTSHMNDKQWNQLKRFLIERLQEIETAKDKKIFYESLNRARQKLGHWLSKDI